MDAISRDGFMQTFIQEPLPPERRPTGLRSSWEKARDRGEIPCVIQGMHGGTQSWAMNFLHPCFAEPCKDWLGLQWLLAERHPYGIAYDKRNPEQCEALVKKLADPHIHLA